MPSAETGYLAATFCPSLIGLVSVGWSDARLCLNVVHSPQIRLLFFLLISFLHFFLPQLDLRTFY